MFGIRDVKREEKAVETEKAVRELIHNKLGYKLVDSDIKVAHRLGSYQSNKEFAVIVPFNSPKVTEEVRSTSRRRASKGSGIVIAEDLTKINAARYQKVRELSGVVRACTKRGEIYALGQNGRVKKNSVDGVIPVQQGINKPGKYTPSHYSPPKCASKTLLRDASHTTGACSPGATRCKT